MIRQRSDYIHIHLSDSKVLQIMGELECIEHFTRPHVAPKFLKLTDVPLLNVVTVLMLQLTR